MKYVDMTVHKDGKKNYIIAVYSITLDHIICFRGEPDSTISQKLVEEMVQRRVGLTHKDSDDVELAVFAIPDNMAKKIAQDESLANLRKLSVTEQRSYFYATNQN